MTHSGDRCSTAEDRLLKPFLRLSMERLAGPVERLQESRDDGYLSASDAAEFLGLTPSALYARVGREQIPHRRVGKRVLFDRRELRGWVEGDR